MPNPEKQDSTPPAPAAPSQKRAAAPKDPKRPFTPDTSGRAKRGSEFRDADLLDAPVEDPDDHIPD